MPFYRLPKQEEALDCRWRKASISVTGAHRNDNPGDLVFGEFTERHGAIHGNPRFAVSPSLEAGVVGA